MEAPPLTVNHDGKLYLSEEAWVKKWKLHDTDKQSGSSSGSRGSRCRGNGLGSGGGKRGNGGDYDSNGSSSSGPVKLAQDQCKKCGKFGH
jgi:hypothetical protein